MRPPLSYECLFRQHDGFNSFWLGSNREVLNSRPSEAEKVWRCQKSLERLASGEEVTILCRVR